MNSFARDLPFGANLKDGGTHFRLWAPKQKRVSVQIEGHDAVPMRSLAETTLLL